MLKNLVYFGSAQFTADIFESLIEAKIVNIVAVVTTPDRPVGRKQIIIPSPLALCAEKYNLPVYKPEKLDDHNLSHLKLLKPDIFLVVAYGQYFTQSWLNAPSMATLNIHFSLLPKYRGSLCISEALKKGDQETGVTLMEMGEKLDAGPIIAQQILPIPPNSDCQILNALLSESASTLLKSKLPNYLNGSLKSFPQDETLATYTPSYKTRTRQNAFIKWEDIEKSLDQNTDYNFKLKTHNFIRSQNPDPGAWTIYNNQELKIIKTSLIIDKNFYLDIVQASGKDPVSWPKFTKNNP